MNFKFQSDCMNELSVLANSDRHSILIEGGEGCGKTYLAKQYSKMLDITDFMIIDSTVQSIKDTLDTCYKLNNPIVLCIENLDKGVLGASYTLLKFLEEPTTNVYIVVTCRNRNKLPDTIISRSACVSVVSPTISDLSKFAESKNISQYEKVSQSKLWEAVRNFKDVETLLNLSDQQFNYLVSLSDVLSSTDNISNLVWKVGHYSDNSETPIELVIRYLIAVSKGNSHILQSGMSCIKDIQSGRIAVHAVISKFMFEVKYGRV